MAIAPEPLQFQYCDVSVFCKGSFLWVIQADDTNFEVSFDNFRLLEVYIGTIYDQQLLGKRITRIFV
jgi:hypothetical protein